jgi:hypothetical protein
MIGQFECPALMVEDFSFWVVAGHEPQEILGEVRVVVESRVRLLYPFVSLWRKERGGMAALLWLWTPIVHLPWVFHGEVGCTKEVYGPGIGIESQSGSFSTVTI